MSAWWPSSLNWTALKAASNPSTSFAFGADSTGTFDFLDVDKVWQAFAQLTLADTSRWMQGLTAYHAAPVPPVPPAVPTVSTFGAARLLDYTKENCDPLAPLVLLVPSLINRAHILDLLAENSFARRLAATHAVWLLDWGTPTATELNYRIDDYLTQVLLPALRQAQASGRPVMLLGYCMGGLLALAAAALQPELVQRLALLATPWHFASYPLSTRSGLLSFTNTLTPWLAAGQPLGVDQLQALFSLLQPLAVYDKFKKIAESNQCDELFVAVEDWLNDGVVLPARVAHTCLHDWFLLNTPGQGQWQVLGKNILPEKIVLPTLVLAPQHDRLVPAEVAAPLSLQMPRAHLQTIETGHIGMIVGAASRTQVLPALQKFFAA